MTEPAEYTKAVRAFASRHEWTTEALYSRAVIDIAVQFLKMPEVVRKDIRRLFMARMLPPATMMNVALSYRPWTPPTYPTAPTRPRHGRRS